jgi:hypothetical protein
VPIWPSTFEPDPSGGEVRILAGERVVAQVGRAVEMCGGETSAEEIPRGNDPMGERELREVSERCPDYYRFVGAGTRIPGNASGGSASPAAAPIPDVVGMKVEEVCPPLRRAGGNAYVFGKREVGDASVIPGHIVAQRPATRVLRPGTEDPRNTLLFVAKPFADTLPDDTSCVRGEVGPPG